MHGRWKMKMIKWTSLFLVFGFLAATQSFASHPLDHEIGRGETDHRVLTMVFDEEADANKAKADQWDFVAEYYEKFPAEFSGSKMTVAEHIAHCREIADHYKRAEKQNREMAAKHRAMIRRGP
jgi:hypothetical protein